MQGERQQGKEFEDMRRRILGTARRKRTDRRIEKDTRLTARSTLAYTIFTGLILVGLVFTICQQQQFNKRQLEVYELSSIPQLFIDSIELDSLFRSTGYNVIYIIKNAGNSPALKVKTSSRVTARKLNPFNNELEGEIIDDVFPGGRALVKARREFALKDTLYLHFRVDFCDFRDHKYYYKVSYFILSQHSDDTAGTIDLWGGKEYTEFRKLGN